MIAPLPQLTPPPMSGEAPGAKPDQGDGILDFAQILAAGPRIAPLSGPPPTRDHGPAIVAAPIDAEVPILDPPSPPVPQGKISPAAAEVFNQDGFFGMPVASSAQPCVEMRLGECPPSQQVPEKAFPTADLSALGPAGVAIAAPSPSRLGGTAAEPSQPARRAPIRIAATASSLAGIAAHGTATVPEIDVSETIKPAIRRIIQREPTPRAMVQVVLRELEQGLHVAARVQAISEPERLRLTNEITTLLARHGLSARSIRIHSSAPSTHLQEKPR